MHETVWYHFHMNPNAQKTVEFPAINFVTRLHLEQTIIQQLGKTPEKKDAIITGTSFELRDLALSHGQTVWGVTAVASDHTEPKKQEKPKRGKKFKFSLK